MRRHERARRSRVLARILVASAGWLAACGSRADPDIVRLPPTLQIDASPPECLIDEDCESNDRCAPVHCAETRCVAETITCADSDPCTTDRCESATGRCIFDPVTADEDGDGFRRPLPGFEPGQVGACGDDCNDTNAAASPNGVERCDGIDNDCDGIVDNGALFSPTDGPALLLSGMAEQGSPGGLTFSDSAGTYGAVFTQHLTASQNTFASIQPLPVTITRTVPVTDVNSDTFSGPIVGRGSVFATAWEDRRDQDYEIYFNRLNTRGEKLGPDVRVTRALGFSLRPTLIEIQSARGQQYRLAWEDERDGSGGRIYGQQLGADGQLVGENQPLTPLGLDPSSPALVAGRTRLGLLINLAGEFNPLGLSTRALGFRSFDFDFAAPTDVVRLGATNPDGATIVANAGRFVVAWHIVGPDSRPGTQIWGSVISETGETLVREKGLTEPAQFARYHSLLPLGDRLILLWSEWRDGRYDIFSRELTPDLEPLGDARAVTHADTEAYAPLAAFGPEGQIGVLFTGRQASSGQPHVFFTNLSCEADADFSLPR